MQTRAHVQPKGSHLFSLNFFLNSPPSGVSGQGFWLALDNQANLRDIFHWTSAVFYHTSNEHVLHILLYYM